MSTLRILGIAGSLRRQSHCRGRLMNTNNKLPK